MIDLTIFYLTTNELPASWVEFQNAHLLKAAGEFPILSCSFKPVKIGQCNVTQTEPKSYWNIYRSMLRLAKISFTPFVAMAEDDVLYTPEHYHDFRPPRDDVSYDRSRWSLFSWDTIYCLRQRISNCSLIAPRELLIEALEERFAKWPTPPPKEHVGEVGRRKVDDWLRVTRRKSVEWFCKNPIVHLNHPEGNDSGDYGNAPGGRRRYKPHGQIKAVEIPYWGKATEVLKHYAPH